ncbi:MAG TPA: tetratricopeptide repeat protein [Gemmatimonadales bacterium]|nr:tetratricopeptide repeat protein [Gemmatimonadales bacterium]
MRPVALISLLLLGGCAYYNGMYNAKRLAGRAERAEREGRTFEAQGLWAQAEVRAESVIVRHPDSRWADDAQLIRGLARARRKDCTGAISPLEAASLSLDSPEVAEQANFQLGECRLELGDVLGADAAFARVIESPDSARRAHARLQHARVLRSSGRYAEALAALEGLSGPSVDGERAAALAGLGRMDDATPLITEAIQRGDLAFPWDSILAAVGRRDAREATRLVDRVVQMPDVTPDQRDRWLGADGVRLIPVDTVAGIARLEQVAVGQPPTNASVAARMSLIEFRLHGARTLSDAEAMRPALERLSEIGGPASIASLGYLRALDRLGTNRDSVTPDTPQGDLLTFLAAETGRDSLRAPVIATDLFRRLSGTWPASPYAPKALLAIAALEPAAADSLRAVLESQYQESPYLTFLRGESAPALKPLEDSLQAFAIARTRPSRQERRPAAAPDAAPPDRRQAGEIK